MIERDFDAAYAEEFGVVCGTDEAGRGPLAGPVVAAAVVLPSGFVLEGLDDSKKLSEKKRDALYDKIIESAVAYGIASSSEAEIETELGLWPDLVSLRGLLCMGLLRARGPFVGRGGLSPRAGPLMVGPKY